MRKIMTEEMIEEKRKRNSKIITIVLLLVLVGGTVGYAFSLFMGNNPNTDVGTESAGRVVNYGNQWVVNFGGTQHVFSNSPENSFNATTLSFIPDVSKYYAKPLYIDSESENVEQEIAMNLGAYAERVNKACYENCEESDYVEKDCTDNLIIYRSSLQNSVIQENNCIFIEGDMRAVDAFLYREIGIA